MPKFDAPRGTPAPVIAKLEKEIAVVVSDEKMKARFVGVGVDPVFMTTAEFAKFVVDEAAKWGKVVKFVGMKPA
jgi:tripartite-type tricarboxylate transporter receptor subunit TctC